MVSFIPRQIFDDPDEGYDIIMELVILGMLMYIWYMKLFPLDEPFITQTPRWKRSTTSLVGNGSSRMFMQSAQDWVPSWEEPIIDRIASFVMKCELRRKLTLITMQ